MKRTGSKARRRTGGRTGAAAGNRQGPDLLERLWDWAVKQLTENILLGEATLITGPPGCGKTTLAVMVAQLLGRPIEIFHYGGAFDPEVSVAGLMTLRGGKTVFVPSRFVDALRIQDCLIVLDELPRAPAEVTNALLSLLDFQRRLVLDQETPDRRIVELAPGVSFIATANLSAGCVGSGPLDAALLDRMLSIPLDYPGPEEEARLLRQFNVSEAQARLLVAKAGAVRAQFARNVLPETISTRGLIRAARLRANGNDADSSIERNMHLLDESSRAKLRATLRATS